MLATSFHVAGLPQTLVIGKGEVPGGRAVNKRAPAGPPALPVPMDYFLGGTTASFMAFETRNFTVVLAAILKDSPVAWFRPMRAAR